MLMVMGMGERRSMAKAEAARTINRYADSRLYDPAAAACVKLQDLAGIVEDDEDFIATEAVIGEDVTRSVLQQIIVKRGRHG